MGGSDVERFVARRLKELRERAGYSRYELARRMGVGVAQVSRLETMTRSPTVATLARFCDALGCSLSEFFAPDVVPALPEAQDDELGELRRIMAGLGEDARHRLARGLRDVAVAWTEPPAPEPRPKRRPRR
jgi:transcriptional regulator with XRE-family HTH domain